MKKMKILQIIPSFGVGGAEKLVVDYLTSFDKNKVEIKAISLYSNKNTINDKFIKENQLDVVYLDKKAGLDVSMIKKLNAIISDYKPDIVHSHLYTVKYILPSAISNKFKWFHTIHNEPEKDAVGGDKLINKIAFKYLKCQPIALSNELALKIQKYYQLKSKVNIVNNGIDLEKFESIKNSKINLRDELGISQDTFIIGHVGRFFKQKNHEFIIDVFSYYLKYNSKSCLLLIGDGELRKQIEDKVNKLGISQSVKFLGIRSDIAELIKCMDVFLFPSLHEGFPITLIEAQALGTRCIISNTIDERVVLSENTISVGLDEDLDIWCNFMKNSACKNKHFGNINEYDIKNITEELLKIYK